MRLFSLLLMAALTVSGCGVLESDKVDYKSSNKLSTLEMPPDLTAPTGDNRYAIPDNQGRGSATLSTYGQARQAAPSGTPVLLPAADKARIERAGTQRWLVVQATPQQVWPVIRDFWQETGFVINVESPETGVIETDWAENRAKIPQDMIRRTLGKVIDGLYSTPERDKFRTRIEATADGTEIFVSHRGMMEVYDSANKDRTVWQPRPADPELEAEMLRRLMLRFGVEEGRAQTLLTAQQAPEQARVIREAGVPQLEVDEAFDRAWRRVGLALDRVGFAVEDRDRSKGVYFVRYIDPEIDNAGKRDEGMLSKFAFWRDKPTQTSPQLQIVVSEAGEKSRVSVRGVDDKPVEPNTQTRILNLLHNELK